MVTFKDSQYFVRTTKELGINPSEYFALASRPSANAYERVEIPTDQVKGKIKTVDQQTFEKLEELYNKQILPEIEKETGLMNLRLQAVRANTLEAGGSVSLHRDSAAYVLTAFVVDGDFEGGAVSFKKDDGEVEEVPLEAGSVFIGNCTNEHGIQEVLSGTRQSVVFFAMPDETAK